MIHAYNFWVRQGELEIGTAAEPFDDVAVITLHGNNTEDYWAFSPQIDSGNKNLVITGKANLYGKPRNTRTILLENAYRGNRTIRVGAGLDWVAGDKIALLASAAEAFNSEPFTIVAYEPADGIVTLDEDVEYFHFGDEDSTASDYNGLDMRSEVLLLTRSITIDASTDDIGYALKDVWGCRVLVADFYERDWSFQTGSLNMDYVQVYNCSQRQTRKPALAFEFANGASSSITNCAIHSGQGQGVILSDSRNIIFSDNTIFRFYEQGITVEGTTAVTLEGNRMGHIASLWTIGYSFFEWKEEKGGVAKLSGNMDLIVRNNVVFGANYYGLEYNAPMCNEAVPTTVFEGNIAHSIAGFGARALPSNRAGGTDCTDVTGVSGYKNWKATVHAADGTGELKCHDITSVDSGYGIACMGAAGGHVEVYDSVIYGSKDIPNVNFERCTDTLGVVAATFGGCAAGAPKTGKWAKMIACGGNAGTTRYHHLEFIGFDGPTNECGRRQRAIGTNHLHPDFLPLTKWDRITFRDSTEDGLFWMASPR